VISKDSASNNVNAQLLLQIDDIYADLAGILCRLQEDKDTEVGKEIKEFVDA
jgi:hypothetical protein